jgi:NhaP-type Na+/H+ and K+/H+ antiporter
MESKRKYNAWASWGLILSLLWGFGLFSLMGLIFGAVGARSIKKNIDSQKGMVRAITAMVMGASGILFVLIHLQTIAEMMAL